MNGSMTMTLPVSVVILVVAWPSQWTSILFVCAQAGSATRLHVRAPAPSLRKSRRSISMVFLLWSVGLDGVADSDESVVEDLGPQAAPVDQCAHRAGLGQAFEVLAGLAEPRAPEPHLADPEFAADQVVERHPRRRDVAAGLSRRELDAEGAQSLERLGLDQGQLATARAG